MIRARARSDVVGRRALRKIDPELDLSHHLLEFDQLPQPWSSEALFGRTAPVEIEIGCGKGLFLESAANGRPMHDFLGVELARKYARFSAARLARRRLENAVVVHGDAQRVVRDVLPDGSVTAVHVYFPDPWWKKRHHKRRVMNPVFLQHATRSLMPGGSLHFWTDVEEYFDATLAIITEQVALAGPFDVAERPAEHDLDFRTHFERRMRLREEPVYRAEFRKKV
jgi:tRNA (guanine-N7-)-methyltransferase